MNGHMLSQGAEPKDNIVGTQMGAGLHGEELFEGSHESLVLLRHIFLREFRGKLRAHAGHRGSRAWPIA